MTGFSKVVVLLFALALLGYTASCSGGSSNSTGSDAANTSDTQSGTDTTTPDGSTASDVQTGGDTGSESLTVACKNLCDDWISKGCADANGCITNCPSIPSGLSTVAQVSECVGQLTGTSNGNACRDCVDKVLDSLKP